MRKPSTRTTLLPRAVYSMTALDAIDRRVVAALQAEGRRAFRSIAEELGISDSVVRYRVQRLEKAGILQVVGIADPLKIGFDLMAMIGVRIEPSAQNEVCAALEKIPETSYVAMVAGRFDAFVEVVCRNSAHFQHLLTVDLHRIPGIVSTESFLILEVRKQEYGWGVGDFGVPVADDSDNDVNDDNQLNEPASETETP